MPEESRAEFFKRVFARQRFIRASSASNSSLDALASNDSVSSGSTSSGSTSSDSISSGMTSNGSNTDGSATDAPEATPSTSLQEPNSTGGCRSPSCSVPANVPHDRSLCPHNGEPIQRTENRSPFGLNNPPPGIWRMYNRAFTGIDRSGDEETIRAFARTHQYLPNPFFRRNSN